MTYPLHARTSKSVTSSERSLTALLTSKLHLWSVLLENTTRATESVPRNLVATAISTLEVVSTKSGTATLSKRFATALLFPVGLLLLDKVVK